MKPEEICQYYFEGDENHFCRHYITPEADPLGLCRQKGQFLCVYDIHRYQPTLSHSTRMQFTQCRQKYYYSKIKGIRVRDHKLPRPMVMGIIWDQFVSHIYKGVAFRSRFEELIKQYAVSDVDRMKLEALFKAWGTVGFDIDKNCELQKEFYILENEYLIHGFVDRSYPTYFVEVKLGKDPRRYHRIMGMISQLSTYFLSNEDYEYCIVESVKLPQLKYNEDKESLEQYKERCYNHIIKNVREYFPGYDKHKDTFGCRFYRSEFPLEAIKRDYACINKDIKTATEDRSFYQNFSMACTFPVECEYLSICETGGAVSEEIYEYRKKEVK